MGQYRKKGLIWIVTPEFCSQTQKFEPSYETA